MLGGVEDGGQECSTRGQSASVINTLRVLHKWEVSQLQGPAGSQLLA